MPDCLTDDNPDYCTVHRAKGRRYVAAVMRYYAPNDEWRIHVSMGPTDKATAVNVAQRWARELHLDYRA